MYDTQLTPEEETAFLKWAQSQNRLGDLADYDLRGAWKAQVSQAGNGHFPDTYKKPNHPTFSDESQYSTPEMRGGHWSGSDQRWAFWASPQNIKNMGLLGLSNYFNSREPDSLLVMESNYRLPRGLLSSK